MSQFVQEIPGTHELIQALRGDGDYVWALRRRAGGAGYMLTRRLPVSGERMLLLSRELGATLMRRWGRTRNYRPVGQRSVAAIISMVTAPAGDTTPDPYPLGGRMTIAGTTYTIVGALKGRRGRGHVRVHATGDAKPIESELCRCGGWTVRVPAADLVTETEFFVCNACRRRIG